MATPLLGCPTCGRTLEYHVTIEMLDSPVGKIDTFYCATCRRMIERLRETDTFYETTMWPPLCRACRQPVTFAGLVSTEPDEETVLFSCQVHSSEQWEWYRPTERWMRRAL